MTATYYEWVQFAYLASCFGWLYEHQLLHIESSLHVHAVPIKETMHEMSL